MRILFTLLHTIIFLACQAQKPAPSTFLKPSQTTIWDTASPTAMGFHQDSLDVLFDRIRGGNYDDFRALIVLKKGKLVIDEYFNSFWITNIHDIRSAGKSVTSLLAGIAIDQGLFKKTDKVQSFFPEYPTIKKKSNEKSEIIVEDLLMMSAGLASDDDDDNSPGREGLMTMEEDYVKFILDLPMDFESGSRYAYSSAVAFLLGAIIENTSGMTLEDFGKKHLFTPLGIQDFYWQKSPKGRTTAMGNLYFQARDLAKLGQLILQKGQWKEQQIISAGYLKASFQKRFDISDVDPFAHGYGYMWYQGSYQSEDKEINFHYASGNGGNKLFIVPELELVVVTLSSAYGQGRGQWRSHEIFKRILAAH